MNERDGNTSNLKGGLVISLVRIDILINLITMKSPHEVNLPLDKKTTDGIGVYVHVLFI